MQVGVTNAPTPGVSFLTNPCSNKRLGSTGKQIVYRLFHQSITIELCPRQQ